MAGLVHVRSLICLAAVALGRAESPPGAAADPPPAPVAPAPSPMLVKLFAGDPPKFDPTKSVTGPLPSATPPRNGIIRLPTYVVREPRPISSADVMTEQGRSDALVKRYVGEPTGLDLMLNKYTFNTLWKKIPLLGKHSNFGWAMASESGGFLVPASTSMTYSDRIASDYSRIEANRKYVEALGVSADVPPTKAEPEKEKKPSVPDDK